MASLKRFNSDKHEKYCSSNGQHMSAYVSASNTSKCSAKFCQVQPAGRDIGHWWRRHVTKYPCRAWRSHFCLPWTSTGAAEAIRSNCRNNELRPRQSSLSAFFSQIISLSHFISFHLAPTNNKNRFLSASYPLPIRFLSRMLETDSIRFRTLRSNRRTGEGVRHGCTACLSWKNFGFESVWIGLSANICPLSIESIESNLPVCLS